MADLKRAKTAAGLAGLVMIGILVGVQAFETGVWAQAPAAAKAPALDKEDALTVQVVTLAAQLANSQCQALDSVKQYTGLLAEANAAIEAKHPGLRMDWTSAKLGPKPAPPAK